MRRELVEQLYLGEVFDIENEMEKRIAHSHVNDGKIAQHGKVKSDIGSCKRAALSLRKVFAVGTYFEIVVVVLKIRLRFLFTAQLEHNAFLFQMFYLLSAGQHGKPGGRC